MSRTLASIAVSANLLLLAGCAALAPTEQEALDRGNAALETKEWARAEQAFSEVINLRTDFTPSYVLRARARFEQQQYDLALDDLTTALESGELDEDFKYEALVFTGRCLIAKGGLERKSIGDGHSGREIEARRKVRTTFVRANRFFAEANTLQPTRYEGILWRAYCYFRLENYRKSLQLLRHCEKISPARWEHRFFKALAIEGIYSVNAESLNTYLEIANRGMSVELTPVVDHLISIYPQVAQEAQTKIFKHVEDFAAEIPNHSKQVASFLVTTRLAIAEQKREAKLKRAVRDAKQLVEKGQFKRAVSLLERLMKKEGPSLKATRVLQAVKDNWSVTLEADALRLSNSKKREDLEKALADYESAQKLTTKVTRLGTLQQKIDAARLVLTRRDVSRKLKYSFELLRKNKFDRVLANLRSIQTDALGTDNRELYNYLRGVANYQLSNWRAAAQSFEKINQRGFQNLDKYHGLALVKSGESDKGATILASIPKESRSDDVNRIIGEHFAKTGRLPKATRYLHSIEQPTTRDYERMVKAHHSLGKKNYRQENFASAIEHFTNARDLLDQKLQRKAVGVYLYLGHSYYHSEDFDRAKKTYDDLSNTRLTNVERERSRDLYLFRAQIHLKNRQPDLAYGDLAQFVTLGGSIPRGSLERRYAWLLATYADFMPLDKIHHWSYVNSATGKSPRFVVKGEHDGGYVVQRHEDQTASQEIWTRDGLFLAKKVGKDLWRIPVNLEPATESFPNAEYERKEGLVTFEYKSEVQSNGETVTLPNGQSFANCLKVRLKRTRVEPGKRRSFLTYVIYLAPDVGEVRREVGLDGVKISELSLSGFTYKSDTLGN